MADLVPDTEGIVRKEEDMRISLADFQRGHMLQSSGEVGDRGEASFVKTPQNAEWM